MFDSAAAAEQAFYAAFARGRLDDMMQVWADAPDIVCIHPGGARLCGVEEIRLSWRHILDDRLPRAFDLRELKVLGDGDLRIHLLEEIISVPGTNFVAPAVLATNAYRRDTSGWRLVLHHASVAATSLPHPLATRGPRSKPPQLH